MVTRTTHLNKHIQVNTMQTNTITVHALKSVLKLVVQGRDVAGYTPRPKSGMMGLFITQRNAQRGKYMGFGQHE